MKKILFLCIALGFAVKIEAQVIKEERKLDSFSKITISPLIDVELIKSDEEKIELELRNIESRELNTRVSGQTLKIFLDHARIHVRERKYYRDADADVIFHMQDYPGGRVKAKIYYRNLSRIQVRGDGYLVCNDLIQSGRFKIKTYGEVDVDLAGVDADKIKGVFYGENKLRVRSGHAFKQKYVSYGTNEVFAEDVEGDQVKTVLYGENRVEVKANHQIKITSFGESELAFYGRPRIKRALVFGPVDYYRISAREIDD